jgi:hypothetical protein
MAGSSEMLGDETQERRENSNLMREAGKRSCQKADDSVARSTIRGITRLTVHASSATGQYRTTPLRDLVQVRCTPVVKARIVVRSRS